MIGTESKALLVVDGFWRGSFWCICGLIPVQGLAFRGGRTVTFGGGCTATFGGDFTVVAGAGLVRRVTWLECCSGGD